MLQKLVLTCCVALFCAFAFWPSPAQAQDNTVVDPDTGEVIQRRTVYDFEDDVIDGQLANPEGDYVTARTARKQSSLIEIRQDFSSEMLRSAEDL